MSCCDGVHSGCAEPKARSQQLQPQPPRAPSVEAPFWEQPLIRDFIATQRPLPALRTQPSGGGMQVCALISPT